MKNKFSSSKAIGFLILTFGILASGCATTRNPQPAVSPPSSVAVPQVEVRGRMRMTFTAQLDINLQTIQGPNPTYLLLSEAGPVYIYIHTPTTKFDLPQEDNKPGGIILHLEKEGLYLVRGHLGETKNIDESQISGRLPLTGKKTAVKVLIADYVKRLE